MDTFFSERHMRLTTIGFHFAIAGIAALAAVALASCSDTQPEGAPDAAPSASDAAATAATASTPDTAAAVAPVAAPASAADVAAAASAPATVPSPADPRVPSAANSQMNQERLKALFDKRSRAVESVDYPIGPGDVIEITVPGVDDLKERTVRVGGDGKIQLPLIGQIQAGGLTEPQLSDELKAALSKYMYSPQVDVFIKEYRSRQVAVVGAVRSPGLITLTDSGVSILDAITQAGGMTAEAADEIVILPEVKGGQKQLAKLAASLSEVKDDHPKTTEGDVPERMRNSETTTGPEHTGLTMASLETNISNGPAIVIPLKSSALNGSGRYINMPVRPGDVLIVPGGGNVMVTGWVYRPGFFQVGSGLTVLGAVGSAGGAMYAAAPSDATLIRSDANGNKVSIPVDLDKIATGAAPDIPVRANDVIDVPYSNLKIGPYVVYNILTRMAVPLPTF
jgi:polysaccharide export outer membrane protein